MSHFQSPGASHSGNSDPLYFALVLPEDVQKCAADFQAALDKNATNEKVITTAFILNKRGELPIKVYGIGIQNIKEQQENAINNALDSIIRDYGYRLILLPRAFIEKKDVEKKIKNTAFYDRAEHTINCRKNHASYVKIKKAIKILAESNNWGIFTNLPKADPIIIAFDADANLMINNIRSEHVFEQLQQELQVCGFKPYEDFILSKPDVVASSQPKAVVIIKETLEFKQNLIDGLVDYAHKKGPLKSLHAALDRYRNKMKWGELECKLDSDGSFVIASTPHQNSHSEIIVLLREAGLKAGTDFAEESTESSEKNPEKIIRIHPRALQEKKGLGDRMLHHANSLPDRINRRDSGRT